MTQHTELYKKMTSLAFKQDISAERVERIGRIIASQQLESAAMLPIERGGSGRRRLQRIQYWAEWRRKFGWTDGEDR